MVNDVLGSAVPKKGFKMILDEFSYLPTASARWKARHPAERKAIQTRCNKNWWAKNRESVLAAKKTPEARLEGKLRKRAERALDIEPSRLAARTYNAKHPEKHQEARRVWRYANPVKRLLQTAKARAKQRGHEFSITEADLMPFPTHCPVLGIELQYGGIRGKDLRAKDKWPLASLDRRDNAFGYVPGNIFIISLRANMLKSDGTPEEHRAIAKWMENAIVAH